MPGPSAIDVGESQGSGDGGCHRGRRDACEPELRPGGHAYKGTPPTPCLSRATARYTRDVARRDPHVVLGVPPDASQATIKAAWRKLARVHHPDVAGSDQAAARVATRRMAEINRAYDELQSGRPGGGDRGPGSRGDARRAGPPPERPTRPVTSRLDTSGTFRPRNERSGPPGSLPGQEPYRGERLDREPRRASQPNGPLARGRDPRYRPAPLPAIEVARAHPIDFGKFHGHTLGEIAAFEPSYIDWLARTISHDPELVASARALRADLDLRGVVRRQRPVPSR